MTYKDMKLSYQALWRRLQSETSRRVEGLLRLGRNDQSNLGHAVDTWVPPGHFYSPIVDPLDSHVLQIVKGFEELELPTNSGIDLDRDRMVSLLERLGKHYHLIPFSPTKSEQFHYYYENPAFSYGDGILLALMMTEFRPKRVIEVGSGFSSCLMIDINDAILNSEVQLTFIDPYPETLEALLPKASPYRKAVLPQRVQNIPVDTFRALEANDILFIDSTHVSKMGSDVNYLIFNVLPALAPGVLVHVHDIPYPFEYPSDWIVKENRSWNEAYVLRAFLAFNPSFEVLFFNHYASRKFPDRLREILPLFLKNGGASIWLRRVH